MTQKEKTTVNSIEKARSGHQGTGATTKHAGKKQEVKLQKTICAPPEEGRWRSGASRLSARCSNSVLKNNFISFAPNPAPFSSLDSEHEGQRPGAVQVRAVVQKHPQEAGNFLPIVTHKAKFQQQKSGPLTPRLRNHRMS